MKIFSGSSNRPLAEAICDHIYRDSDEGIGKIKLKSFDSGERYCQFEENIRGEDVFLIQSLSTPVNDHLMELLLMADAARRASAERITAVIPYFGYCRQDRKDKPRVPISAKLVMNLLMAAGFDRVLTMDLHAPQIGGFTDLPLDHLSFRPALVEALKIKCIDSIVSPDIGAVKRADEYARVMDKELVILSKKRKSDREVNIINFVGEVKGLNVVIIDDISETSGTLVKAAAACKSREANKVYCAVSHGCFTNCGQLDMVDAFERGIIDGLFTSDTVHQPDCWKRSGGLYGHGKGVEIPNYNDRVHVVSVAGLFAKAIENIHNNLSVSELFR
jgi:ribose-phosphate pyrophosphokinase